MLLVCSILSCAVACGHLFFLAWMWPPPLPPLFPYTTLFRSRSRRGDRGRNRAVAGGTTRRGRVRGGGAAGPEAGPVDRKSTRLNSSHRCISYAVFCLKKKISSTKHRHTSEMMKSLPLRQTVA